MTAKFNASALPEELKAYAQWVCADTNKAPINPKTGGRASVADPNTWGTFGQAVEYAVLHALYIGFVLTENDPFAIIDQDDKENRPATPEQKERHEKIIGAFGSYTERSMSGRGTHIIVKGVVPHSLHRDNVEVYSKRHYVILTGDVLRDAPIADCQPLLDQLVGEMKPAPTVELEEEPEVMSDCDLVDMAMKASNGEKFNDLCAGKWEELGYPSQSEADLALISVLAFYSSSDTQVLRLFSYSILGKREKARRRDYLTTTLQKARRLTTVETNAPPRLEARTISLDLVRNPPLESFVCGHLFPFGKASVIYGPQGAGKSVFLSQLAFTFASSDGAFTPFLGMDMRGGGPVVVYSAEDTFDDWVRKAAAYCYAFNEVSEHCLSQLYVVEKTEGFGRFTELTQLRVVGSKKESVIRTETRRTPEWDALRALAFNVGAKLIIIETTSRLVPEETNQDLAALVGACGHLAAETGAAVVLSHHPTKAASTANDSSPEAARGGSAFVNNSRTAVSLFPAAEDEQKRWEGKLNVQDILTLGHAKPTSSVPRQAPITLVRCSTPWGAVLRLPEDAANASSPADDSRRRMAVAREERQHREQMQAIYDTVAWIKENVGGRISINKLVTSYRTKLGLPKHVIEERVPTAIAEGVLEVTKRDSEDRILDMVPGVRPEEPPSQTA